MRRGWLLIAALAPAGCAAPPDRAAGAAARAEAGTALVALERPTSAGQALFQSHCSMCHAEGKLYPGTVQLHANDKAHSALALRTDLDPDYVRQVARQGLGSMPGFTPMQLSDPDLDKIAHWLAKK